MANTIGELNVEIGARLDKLEAALTRMERSVQQSGQRSHSAMSGSMKKIGGAILAAFSTQVILNFSRQVIAIRSEFEKFEAVLTNTLGSAGAARLALLDIKDMAKETPFSVAELSDAFVKLTNYGLQPTMEAMTQYADLASAVGRSFDEMAEAVADATTGEFERLKSFGIRASKEGDKVTFTFKGIATEVDFTSAAIENYIRGLGDLEGVQGSAIAQMDTLGGSVSNLGDKYMSLMSTIGETSIFKDSVTFLGDLAETTEVLIHNWSELPVDELRFWTDTEYSVKALTDAQNKYNEKLRKSAEELAKQELLLKENEKAFWSLMYGMDPGETLEEYLKRINDQLKEKRSLEGYTKSMEALNAEIQSLVMGDAGEAFRKLLGMDFKPIDLGDLAEIGLDEEEGILDPATESLDRYTAGLAVAADAANLFGGVLQSSFDAALMGGQNFFDVFGKALKQMIAQLAAAAASALVLSTIISVFTGGGIGGTFKKMFFGDPTKGGAAGLAGGFGGLILSGTDLTSAINRTQTTTRRTNGG